MNQYSHSHFSCPYLLHGLWELHSFQLSPSAFMTWRVFSDHVIGLHFSTSYFIWNDKSLLPAFLSSLVMHNVGGCPPDFPCCPFPQCSTVSFVASFCSSSVKHHLTHSNRHDGFIIWDCRSVFTVLVLSILGSESISVLGRVFTFQGTIPLCDLLLVSQELTKVS